MAGKKQKGKKSNPLSYLGWLGAVGIIGINTGDFMLQFFLVYFFFFLYKNMPADELFWANVRKIAFRTFILCMIMANVLLITWTIIQRIRVGNEPWALIDGVSKAGLFGYFILVVYFIFSLMHCLHVEKKELEEENA